MTPEAEATDREDYYFDRLQVVTADRNNLAHDVDQLRCQLQDARRAANVLFSQLILAGITPAVNNA